MNINDLNPRTVAVLDIKLNQKPYSGSGMANSEEHHYITHTTTVKAN